MHAVYLCLWEALSVQMSPWVMFAVLGVRPHRVNVYLYAEVERRGVSDRIWRWDGSNGISLWQTQPHKHTMLAAWVAVPGSLIFLQLDPHPMASTDASKHSSKLLLREELYVSLKGHLLPKSPYNLLLNVYYFLYKYGSWPHKNIPSFNWIEVCMILICETNAWLI